MRGAIAKSLTACAVALAFLAVARSVNGQEARPSGCERPAVPEKFNTTEDYNIFVDQTMSYRHCIDEFVKKQRELSKLHAERGSAAAEEWNAFAATIAKLKPPAK